MTAATEDHGITPTVVAVASRGQVVPSDVDPVVIDNVVETVRRLCGWHVWPPRRETVTIRDHGDATILLPTLRLVEVHEISTAGKTYAPETYEVYEDGTVDIHRYGPFDRPRKLEADITHGFDNAPGLIDVVANMVIRTIAGTGDGSLSVGGVSYHTGTGVTPRSSEWVLIDRYKLGPRP